MEKKRQSFVIINIWNLHKSLSMKYDMPKPIYLDIENRIELFIGTEI